MGFPGIKPWVKQAHQRTISRQRSNVAALVPVAKSTGVSQVFSGSSSAVFLTDDVVNLAAECSVFFLNVTVFAPSACAQRNFPA